MSRVFKTKENQITQSYKKGNHNGIDLVGYKSEFDYIVAHSDGTVVEYRNNYSTTDKTGDSYGNYVKINHDNNYYTLYAHMKYKSVTVKKGDKVKKGQTIGYMGATGRSTGAHLHFEVWNGKDRINPTPYIDADLPKPTKINVTYQVYDNQLKKYWGEVTNYNNTNSNGYAGYMGHSIGGIRAKASEGTITIQTHIKGGQWLSPITKWDNTSNGYSGIYGKDIDMVMIKSSVGTAKYRVHLKGGNWLGWVTKYNIKDSVNGMAGIYGKSIDAIQIEII